MTTRQKLYSMYALAHAGRVPPLGAPEDAAAAVAIGVLDGRVDGELRTVDGLMARLRELGVTPEEEQDDEPDVGPSERDRRQLEDAQVRLRELIRADGVTETGDRWLYDAAAEEIVRLRANVDRAWAKASGQGAAEMRDRAAALCDDEAKRAAARGNREQASTLWGIRHGIRALPLDASRVAISADDAAALRADGWEEQSDGMWFKARGRDGRYGFFDPRTERGARWLRRLAQEARPRVERTPVADVVTVEQRREIDAPPTDGLSAEDVATLRGAGWEETYPGTWIQPAGVRRYQTLRWIAAGIRADKAPAAEQKRPEAEAGPEVSPAAGGDIVADERGVSQEATRRPCLPVWVIGSSKPGCMAHAPGDARCTIGAASLPKPARVEVGQRWRRDGHPFELQVRGSGYAVHLVDNGGDPVDASESAMLSDSRWRFFGYVKPEQVEPFQVWSCVGIGGRLVVRSITTFTGAGPEVGLSPDGTAPTTVTARAVDMLGLAEWAFLGLAPTPPEPKRDGGEDERGSPAAQPTDAPTPTDAVVGMLMRHGFDEEAVDIVRGLKMPERIAVLLKSHRNQAPERIACIAALDALTRGDLRGASDHQDLYAAIERLARERDEARTEAEGLRDEVERLAARGADLERQRDEASKDALEAMREAAALRSQLDCARSVRASK